MHEARLARLACPVLRLDGAEPTAKLVLGVRDAAIGQAS
jgi:hypothetical protein